ncbi:protein-L-isoaspartate O-methyltransferase [Massilia arenosa]|uniref:Protein-L-isoaspartate O-methyltransferase n=1 Tax=Zemynaea arenosa TaxID=2561931 RepID=A0A4Y9SQJ1_9BURK|nr:protein-L-isoaspartate O-methyltransferase [Massilia arenosa]TFW28745.1 protein-L-isoaspartate O-methyltransferase [Massilia arenosa]
MNIEQARFNMIEQQIRPWNVLDQDVLDLLVVVKREQFVPAAYKALAFADTEIPLGHGASMFFPKIEARLMQELQVKKHEKVLEIGSGSGYMAALLATRGQHVTTVEIEPELKEQAQKNLAAAGIANVKVELGNGAEGWAQGAPYDVIVISGALEVLPDAFLKQLKVGGRLACLVGNAPVQEAQIITRVSDTAYDTAKVFETNVAYLRAAPVPSHFTF